MAGESSDPQAAASEYEQQLRLATKTLPSAQPSLDLILLGLGEDGHTSFSVSWDINLTGPPTRDCGHAISERFTQQIDQDPSCYRAIVILSLIAGAAKQES